MCNLMMMYKFCNNMNMIGMMMNLCRSICRMGRFGISRGAAGRGG